MEEGIVIHDFVRVLAVNDHLGRMFGYAEQEVVGTDPFKLIQSSERGGVETRGRTWRRSSARRWRCAPTAAFSRSSFAAAPSPIKDSRRALCAYAT